MANRRTSETALTNASLAAGPKWTYTHRGYALAQSFRQLRQRKFASFITLMVFGISLALPAIILFSAGSLAKLGNHNIEQESLTVYLSMQVNDLDGASLAQQLLLREGIDRTSYVSRDEALAMFKEQSDIGDALAALGNNPLPGAIIVYPDVDMLGAVGLKQLANSLAMSPSIDRVQFDFRWVKRLQAVLSLARLVGWVLAGFLTLSALLVIGNTIRLELLRKQTELDVSRLLGAKRSFLVRPLVYTGALYGFLGGLVACVIALITISWIKTPADQLSGLYQSAFQLEMPTASQCFTVLLIATCLGVLGSIVSLARPSNHLLPFGTKPV